MNSRKHFFNEKNINRLREITSNNIFEINKERIEYINKRNKKHDVKKLENNEINECNLCGYRTEYEFLPFLGHYRRNEVCPNCDSKKRIRAFDFFLKHYTDLFEKENKVLHVAPEVPMAIQLEKINGDNYIACDIDDNRPLNKETIDIHSIPYDDNTFDYVISSHVMEHVFDDDAVYKEIYRVLKPGGMYLFLIPSLYSLKNTFEFKQINTKELKKRYNKQSDHMRYYSHDDVYRKLLRAGFIIKREQALALKNYFLDETKKYNISPEPIYIAIKESEERFKEYNTYECNVCGYKTIHEYLPRKDVVNNICPKCRSHKPLRLLTYYLDNYEDMTKDKKILQVSSERGLGVKLYEEHKENFTLYEIDENTDINHLPFEENNFDYIISNDTLLNVKDHEKLLEEFYRILKHGGKNIFIISTISKENKNESNTDTETQEEYTYEDINKKLTQAQFKVIPMKTKELKEKDEKSFEKYNIGLNPIFIAEKEV